MRASRLPKPLRPYAMGKTLREIDQDLHDFIRSTRMFFTASAPRSERGHINLSPKGLDTLRVLGPREVAYLDFVGSGVETIAHVRENGRLVLMFCAFEGPPKILRLWGRARVVEPEDGDFAALRARFESPLPARAIVHLAVERIAESCGYGVPLFDFRGEREQIGKWCASKGEAGLETYKDGHNARSIDGLPGLRSRCP